MHEPTLGPRTFQEALDQFSHDLQHQRCFGCQQPSRVAAIDHDPVHIDGRAHVTLSLECPHCHHQHDAFVAIPTRERYPAPLLERVLARMLAWVTPDAPAATRGAPAPAPDVSAPTGSPPNEPALPR